MKCLAVYEIVNVEGVNARFHVIGVVTGSVEAIEHVRRHVKSVRPDSHLGIIRKPGMAGVIRPHPIKPPAARNGIARLRDRDALVVRAVLDIAPGKIRHDKAIELRHVDHRRIATVKIIARSSGIGAGPKTVECEGGQRCARRFVVNRD